MSQTKFEIMNDYLSDIQDSYTGKDYDLEVLALVLYFGSVKAWKGVQVPTRDRTYQDLLH